MQRTKRVAVPHGVARLAMKSQPHGRIDGVFFFLAAATECDAGAPELFALHGSHVTLCWAWDVKRAARARQAARIVHDSGIAILQADDLTELITRATRGDLFGSQLFPCGYGDGAVSQIKHPPRQLETKSARVGRPAAAENFQRFDDFERVTSGTAQRLIHIGDQRDDALAHACAGFDEQFREVCGVLGSFHKCAGAGFHIEHESVNSFGKFLAHDRSANQAGAFDRTGHIAQGVHFLIGGRNFRRLANQGAATGIENAAEPVEREVHVKAGDGFELVERAAAVAQSPAADHGYAQTASRDDGRDHQRRFIANTASGMFVDELAAVCAGKIEDTAGVEHRFGERGNFGARQATARDRHQPSRHLVIGNPTARVAVDEPSNFFAGKFRGIALAADEIDGAHARRG